MRAGQSPSRRTGGFPPLRGFAPRPPSGLRPLSQPLPEEALDGVVDLVLVADLAGDDLVVAGQRFLDVGLEAAAPVRLAHLAKAEQVELGQQSMAQEIHAQLGVAAVAVFAVREVEEV